MFAIVIPAKDEANRLINLLNYLLSQGNIGQIIVVLNGCRDKTWDQVAHLQSQVLFIHYHQPLGYDVPRAIGAYYGYLAGAQGVVFVDGDMTGAFAPHIFQLQQSLKQGVDLALCNCYPYVVKRHPLIAQSIGFRLRLNKSLGLYHQIGIASPSHGILGVSRRLMETVQWKDLAIPPVSMAVAKKAGLNIKVATAISHFDLGSKIRHEYHAKKITDTIIGDCLEAQALYLQAPRTRDYQGITYLGYHPLRRFDLLTQLTSSP